MENISIYFFFVWEIISPQNIFLSLLSHTQWAWLQLKVTNYDQLLKKKFWKKNFWNFFIHLYCICKPKQHTDCWESKWNLFYFSKNLSCSKNIKTKCLSLFLFLSWKTFTFWAIKTCSVDNAFYYFNLITTFFGAIFV